jgi:hypothetical protein
MQTPSRFAPPGLVASLCLGLALFLLPLSAEVRAESCVPEHDGTCNGHPECDSTNKKKHCRDTLTSSGYVCRCRTGTDNRTHRHAHSGVTEDNPNYMQNYQPSEQTAHGAKGSGEGSPTPPPPTDQNESAPKNPYDKPPGLPGDQNSTPH